MWWQDIVKIPVAHVGGKNALKLDRDRQCGELYHLPGRRGSVEISRTIESEASLEPSAPR